MRYFFLFWFNCFDTTWQNIYIALEACLKNKIYSEKSNFYPDSPFFSFTCPYVAPWTKYRHFWASILKIISRFIHTHISSLNKRKCTIYAYLLLAFLKLTVFSNDHWRTVYRSLLFLFIIAWWFIQLSTYWWTFVLFVVFAVKSRASMMNLLISSYFLPACLWDFCVKG